VRFVDFLRATVLSCAATATALGALAVLQAAGEDDTTLLVFTAAWWAVAAAVGLWLGRRAAALPPIARLLGEARATTTLPEQRAPGRMLLNRLWPLFAMLVASAGLAWAIPQVPAVASGFAVAWALYWRRQDAAVTAIEERDGIAFFLEPTSPFAAIRLLRTPGFRRVAPPSDGLG
jgi:hypothetical protein